MAHGDRTDSEEFGQTIERGFRWLIYAQTESGGFRESDPHEYAHPICAYALSEAFALMRLPDLKEPAIRAINRIVAGQNPDGGWNYNLQPSTRNDMSYSAWCIQALKAAQLARLNSPGIQASLQRALSGTLRQQIRSTGRFSYTEPGNGSGDLTGAGVLCLQLLGAGDSDAAKQGIAFMKDWTGRWSTPQGKSPLYYWYYATQAKFHASPATWKKWNGQFDAELRHHQKIVEKAILTPSGTLASVGYWESCQTSEHGRSYVYNTTLCALMLQVYYRALPTYMTSALTAQTPETDFAKDESEIALDSY